MNDLTQYNAIRGRLRPGDIIVFWGRAPLSLLIEFFDAGPSHCAIVRQPLTADGDDVTISQSTIQHGVNGVQTDPLGWTIAAYGAGEIAALRLDDATRAKIDWQKFYKTIGAAEGSVQYDTADLVEFLLRDIPVLGVRAAQGEHKTKMVCSAWVTALLEASGVLRGIDYTATTPQQLVEMRLYSDCLPLLGNPHPSQFNTI
jgi:hypothetical protein